MPGGVEGYANEVSVTPGQTVAVYVRARANYVATILRMGFYDGAGARQLARLPIHAAETQPPCPVEALGMVECHWRRSFSVQVPVTWPSGVYAIKLASVDHSESYVPFVVREKTPVAPILFQVSVATWQAYNTWGGRDLYLGPCPPQPRPNVISTPSPSPSVSVQPSPSPTPDPSPSPILSPVVYRLQSQQATQQVDEGRGCGFANRARAVSFDRPYGWPGFGQFFRFEYPMLYWLESRGYKVAYTTDVDLHEGNDALPRRQIFIAAGHDEYYSLQMRRALEDALQSGTNLIFMGADDLYRHIRFAPSALGRDRVIINYKVPGEDPLTLSDPLESTGQWRDWPTNLPEQALLGAEYECNPVSAPWVPTGDPAWLFKGTKLHAGVAIPHLVGYEYDKIFSAQPQPAGLVPVARSPVFCSGRESHSDSTFYVAASGAGVFDAGTLNLVCALGPTPHACQGIHPDPRVQRLMANLVEAMRARRFG